MTGHVPRIKARLALESRRKVRGLLEGEYAALQVGRGMEFNDLREYVRGDDVKDLDWKASARSGQMLVKRYVAVRKHTVLLAVSTGRSMAAANSLEVSKRDLAVQVAGLLGWLAVRQGDLVGTVYGDAAGQHGLPARTGELHLERCLDAAYDATTPAAARTDLVAVLRHVARTVRRRTILLVVCDEDETTVELTAALRRLVVQHEILLVTVGNIDPVAVAPRAPALHDLDRDRGLPAWLRGDAQLLQELRRADAAARASFHRSIAALGVVHEHVAESEAALDAVRRLLARNSRARRR
jgi:uncharacterized protein (DUF58 family)